MNLRRAIASVGVAAAVVVSGAVVAAPANATTKYGCKDTYLCAYRGSNYQDSTGPGPVADNNQDLTMYPKFRYMQSIFNNGTQCTAYLFSQTYYQGYKHTLSRGEGYPNLNNIPEFRTTGVQSNRWCK